MAINSNQTNATVDMLLDGFLDDLADKPEFKPFPIGAHRCKINWEPKNVDKVGSGVQINLVVIKTEELANSGDKPCNPGDKTNIMFFFTHEQEFVRDMGQGQFKDIMAHISEKLGKGTNRELMAKTQNGEALILTGQRQNKDKTQTFTSIEGFELL